jgi:hypothetical protein
MGSMKIVRQISDFLCAERGLSIIENPQKSKGCYRDWQDRNEPQTNKDKLREMIDNILSAGVMFSQFIGAMHNAGCGVKQGKYLAFKIPGAERYTRVKSLGEDYTEEALRKRCLGKDWVTPKTKTDGGSLRETEADKEHEAQHKAEAYAEGMSRSKAPSLLIDIQAKIAAGASAPGYVQWMRIFNIKQAAHTLIYLKENGIDSYNDLCVKATAACNEFVKRNERIKAIEERQKSISDLQKQIGVYGKTRSAWERYKNSGYDPALFEAERADLTLHKAAKNYFNAQGFKGKLPSINSLKQEWATLESERRSLYVGYKELRQKYIDLCTAESNARTILGIGKNEAEHTIERQPKCHGYDAR